MARKVVRSKSIRKVIAWSLLGLLLLGAAFLIPNGIGLIIVGILLILATGLFCVFLIPCTVIAIVYWVRTGFITNPLRHGPWGDWKGEL